MFAWFIALDTFMPANAMAILLLLLGAVAARIRCSGLDSSVAPGPAPLGATALLSRCSTAGGSTAGADCVREGGFSGGKCTSHDSTVGAIACGVVFHSRASMVMTACRFPPQSWYNAMRSSSDGGAAIMGTDSVRVSGFSVGAGSVRTFSAACTLSIGYLLCNTFRAATSASRFCLAAFSASALVLSSDGISGPQSSVLVDELTPRGENIMI